MQWLTSFPWSRSVKRVAAATIAILGCCSGTALAADYQADAEFTQDNHGGYVWLWSGALHVDNPSTDFVTDELWVLNSSATHWVEAGIFEGQGRGNAPYDKPTFFWADNRDGGGYSEHDDFNGSASLNGYYQDYIEWNGPGTWAVYVGGFTGTSTNNPLVAEILNTGTEETTRSATACNGQHGTSWWDTNGGYHSDSWPKSVGFLSNPPAPPDVKYVDTAQWHDWSNDYCY